MTHPMRDRAGSVNLRCLPYRNRAPILPAAGGQRAAVGVTLACEHVGWYTPAALTALAGAVDHPALRIYCDMGNCPYVWEDPLE